MSGAAGSTPGANVVSGDVLGAYLQQMPRFLSSTDASLYGPTSGPTTPTDVNGNALTKNSNGKWITASGQVYGGKVLNTPQGGAVGQAANALNTYLPQVAQTESATNLGQLQGTGGQAALAAQNLMQHINPNWYNTSAAANTQAQNLVNSINLGGLSGGETAAVERALNQQNTQTGNLGNVNATNTVTNAMNFGQALDAKRTALGNALGAATGTLNSTGANSLGFSPVNLATNAVGGNSALGSSQFGQSTGQQAALQSGLLSGMTGIANTSQGLQTGVSNANSIVGASNSAVGSVCCFIFMEAYNGELPEHVRVCRDGLYHRFPETAVGYKKMARVVVPLMQRSRIVRWLINTTMVKPLTKWGGWLLDKKGYEDGYRYGPYVRFWLSVWRMLATI